MPNWKVQQHEMFPGVYWAFDGDRRFLCTKNRFKGFHVSDERLISIGSDEYRFWEPSRSKLGAAIVKGIKTMPIKPGASILYLGAANGITSSYVSDMVGPDGAVFCVEFSSVAMKDLIRVCEKRDNMFPILADARYPELYSGRLGGKADVVYEDVADKDQDGIMKMNARACLKKGGYGMLAVKARSVDSAAAPHIIFERVRESLKANFDLEEAVDIDSFEKDHEFLLLRFK